MLESTHYNPFDIDVTATAFQPEYRLLLYHCKKMIRRVFLGVAPYLPTANSHTGQDARRRCTENSVRFGDGEVGVRAMPHHCPIEG